MRRGRLCSHAMLGLVICLAVMATSALASVSEDVLTAQLTGRALIQVQLAAGLQVWGSAPVFVAPGQQLILTGHPSGSSLLQWSDTEPSIPPNITLSSGAQMQLIHLTILLADSASATVAGIDGHQLNVTLPNLQPWPVNNSAIIMRNATLQLAACAELLQLQAMVCASISSTSELWDMLQVMPGSVTAHVSTTTAALDGVTVTCLSWNSNTSTSGPPPCIIRSVDSQATLLDSLTSAQQLLPAQSAVVLQFVSNISLSSHVWPSAGVILSTNTTLVGPPSPTYSRAELSMGGVLVFVDLEGAAGTLNLANLAISNLSPGPVSLYPGNLFLGAFWCVNFSRNSATRIKLTFVNTATVIPSDLFAYLSYWAGIQSSIFTSISSAANWLLDTVYYDLQVASVDGHLLMFARRYGLGISWKNSSLTDLPFYTPQLLASTGISELVPGSPFAALPLVQAVFTPSQLVSVLTSPVNTTRYVCIMNNMRLDPTVLHGNASLSGLVSDTPSLPPAFSIPLTIIGPPHPGLTNNTVFSPVVLDLGGFAGSLRLAVPPGSRMTLQRLVLVGLGQGSANDSTDVTRNLTSSLWAFGFSRRQVMVRLLNVTIVVDTSEVLALQAVAGLVTSRSSDPTIGPAVLQALASLFSRSDVSKSLTGSLTLSNFDFNGVDGTQVIITSQLPDGINGTTITPAWPVVLSEAAVLESDGSSGSVSGGGLKSWQIAVIVVVLVVATCVTVVAIVACWRWRTHKLLGDMEVERLAKDAALQQVQALVLAHESILASSRGTGSQDGMSLTSIHIALNSDEGGGTRATSRQPSIPRAISSLQAAALRAAQVRLPPSTNGSLPSTASLGSRLQAAALKAAQVRLPPSVNGSLLSTASLGSRLQASSRAATRNGQAPASAEARLVGSGSAIGDQTSSGGTPAHCADAATEMMSCAASAVEPVFQRSSIFAQYDPLMSLASMTTTAAPEGRVIKQLKEESELSRTKSPNVCLEGGLALGEHELSPQHELAAIVEQRALMQGVDMQQVDFVEVVGQGSFGVVYRGTWRHLEVAIKSVMFADATQAKRIRQRAITEAAINTILTHRNIVNTYATELKQAVGTGPDEKHAVHWKLFIISEFCEGGSLAQAVDRGMFLEPGTQRHNVVYMLQIALDISLGMAYIHENNVLHGDLSSGNILLRADPRSSSTYQAKVGDFGLSRFLTDNESHISNARQGTPFYVAPETLIHGHVSRESDVFSYGVLLWEMFYGRPPWRDPEQSAACKMLNTLTFAYTLPMECPVEWNDLVVACLAPDPKARPRFSEINYALNGLLDQLRQLLAARTLDTALHQIASGNYVWSQDANTGPHNIQVDTGLDA